MSDLQDTPAYKLSDVLVETGLSADVVRVWEKRYGLPAPRRSAGGHRLYSRRDIRTLQWLQARVDAGMRISKAVHRWRELEAAGLDPLTADSPAGPSPLDPVRVAWLHACLDFDERRAEAVLDAAFAAHPAEAVCLDVLRAGLHEIGAMWYRVEASVQQEHFTAELATRRLHRLMAAAPAPSRDGLLLVGTPSGERHAFPALLLATLLRGRGCPVRYLGADLPLEQLQHALGITRPAAVLYAVQMLGSIPALQETAVALHKAGIPLGYGGRVFNRFPGLRARLPAFFLGERLPDALDGMGALVQIHPEFPPSTPVAPALQRAAEALRLHAPHITARVTEQARRYGVGERDIDTAMAFNHRQWYAALRLGDLSPMRAEMRWVEGLLRVRGVEAALLETAWQLWRDAVAEYLGEAAAPILAFLDGAG
ncbi:MAG: hypothetical protein Fur0018_23410 [Anaerolineales bacterium]